MTAAEKVAHRAEALKGTAMTIAGRLTGNRRLRARGRRNQAKSNIKQYLTKVKGAFGR